MELRREVQEAADLLRQQIISEAAENRATVARMRENQETKARCLSEIVASAQQQGRGEAGGRRLIDDRRRARSGHQERCNGQVD